MRRNHRRWRLLAAALVLALLSGCAGIFSDYSSRRGVSSSVVNFLYPKGEKFEPATEGMSEVRLPARVGVAFVPSSYSPQGLTAADRGRLLGQVRDAFKAQDFIERIETIPDTYLRQGGGFENLEQVARLYGVDIIALISYDQLDVTTESAGSLLYWTIVGAYTIPGTRNQMNTFVDTTVFDIASHKLLMRAPGVDQRQRISTAVGSDKKRDTMSRDGFNAAVADMIPNLDGAIRGFGERAQRGEAQVRLVDRRSGDSWKGGGGSTSPWDLILLLAALGGFWLLRSRS